MSDLLNRKRFITAEYIQKKNDAVTQLSNFLKDVVFKAMFGECLYDEFDKSIATFWKRVLYWEFSKEQRKGLLCSFKVNKETTTEIVEELLKPFKYRLILQDEFYFTFGDYSNNIKDVLECEDENRLHLCYGLPKLSTYANKTIFKEDVVEMYEYLQTFHNDSEYFLDLPLDDCFFIDTICLLEDVEKYIEEGVIPFEPFEKFLDAPTPKQQNTREEKIKEVCEMAGNDYWKRLLDAGVIKWKYTTDENEEPFCELTKDLQTLSSKGLNLPLLSFVICVVNDMCDLKINNRLRVWEVSSGYDTRITNPQIAILFGNDMKPKIKDAIKNFKDNKGQPLANKLPKGSDRILNELNIEIN